MPVEVVCSTCSDTFEVKPYRADTARYCSEDCKHGDKQVNLTCDWCGDEYTVAQHREESSRFCGLDCLYQGRTTRWQLEENGHAEHLPKWLQDRAQDFGELREHVEPAPKQQAIAPDGW